MSQFLSAGVLVLTGLTTFCLWMFPLQPLDAQVFGFSAFALLLEFSSIHLPTFGFVSASFPIYFLLVFVPGGSPSTAALVVLLILFLRAFFRTPERRLALLEFLVDGFSILSALVVGGLLRDVSVLEMEGMPIALPALVAPLVIYATLQIKLFAATMDLLEIPDELYQAQIEAVSLQARASAMSAPALLLLVSREPWHILWTLPVFLALYQFNWERLSELRKARAEKTSAKVELRRKDRVLLETAKNVKVLQSQKRLVQKCSASFARTTNSEESFRVLVTLLRDLAPLNTIAVSLFKDGRLVPLYCNGPNTQLFLENDTTGIRENLINKAWSSGEVQRLTPKNSKHKVFERENVAVAFPLHGQGVLYIGATVESFDPEAFQQVATVAYQFSLSLQSTMREEALIQTVEEVQNANRQIELGRERLVTLLQGSHRMSQTLEAGGIVEEACRTLKTLFQPDFLLVRVANWGEYRDGQEPPGGLLNQVIEKLSGHEIPYCLELLESSEGRAAFTGHQLLWEERRFGFVLMSSPDSRRFARGQRRFLELLALHFSVMLTNSTLFRDVQKARKDLEESQAQLIQSSKLAAVGQLAAGVAHEINTPLGAVLLSLQAANRQLRKGRYEKVQEKLDDGVKGTQAAKTIVNKLLFYSREGRSEQAEVVLSEVVDDTIQFLGSQISDDNITITKEVTWDCVVLGNQNELQQILTNFLVNARDAIMDAQRQEGSIKVAVKRIGKDVALSVTDNGVGFAADVKERAFEPFYTTKPVGKGTGLGLHVSRQIAQKHGGRIEMNSRPGEGATLTLVLPCQESGESQ